MTLFEMRKSYALRFHVTWDFTLYFSTIENDSAVTKILETGWKAHPIFTDRRYFVL